MIILVDIFEPEVLGLIQKGQVIVSGRGQYRIFINIFIMVMICRGP